MIKRTDIQIRDPYILKVEKEGKYYLYGTTDKDCWHGEATGFDAYSSIDLENFEGPFKVFRPSKNFWADENFWAPEVYYYNNKFYMLASFKADGKCRGTQILVSDSAKGPFMEHSNGPITPSNWECLDGTLYIDEDNNPWMVFCHEWLQVVDGEIWAVQLTNDLTKTKGEPKMLFKASDAAWTKGNYIENMGVTIETYVTDGPFLYKTQEGKLIMLWSSYGEEGYAIGIARSETGNVLGPWHHDKEPLFKKDGGHGMLFKTFENKLMLTIHVPNITPNERVAFFGVEF